MNLIQHSKPARQRNRIYLSILAAASCIGLFAAQPAITAPIRTYAESNYASIDLTNRLGGRYWVEVCDKERDGNGVYATFNNWGGWKTVRDPDGSEGGCGNAYVDSTTNSFRVCEDRPWYQSDVCSSRVSF